MMKLKSLVLILMLLVPVLAHAQKVRSSYVGYEYKGVRPSARLPNGVKHLGGGLIGDFEAETVYGISQVERGRTKMLWFESSTGKDAAGITGWKVIDVVSFPGATPSDHLLIYGDPAVGCRRFGKDIPNLVGIGRIMRKQGVFRPTQLWIANLTTKRFQPVKLAGVKCGYAEP